MAGNLFQSYRTSRDIYWSSRTTVTIRCAKAFLDFILENQNNDFELGCLSVFLCFLEAPRNNSIVNNETKLWLWNRNVMNLVAEEKIVIGLEWNT